ncbi:MAG: HAMP domain-containing sensor histidine kinase [Planctomycetota bacterium]|nr:HAMP domain-containing sensor histidine kinase [Planctomycetota bacterium]
MRDFYSRLAAHQAAGQLRVGLQLKSVLILTFLVVAVALTGGWFYYVNAKTWLRDGDQRHARRIAQALDVASRGDLLKQRSAPLRRLVSDFIRRDNVRFIALLDAEGKVVASVSGSAGSSPWSGLVNLPVTVSASQDADDGVLTLSRPVFIPPSDQQAGELVGAVRLVTDTSETQARLVKIQQRIGIIAAAIVLCATPLGYLLVWRLIVQPVRRLVGATRKLAGGDFTVRAGLVRNDEIGELAVAFNAMADEVARMRDELLRANEELEHKVNERTDELQRANRRLREEMADKEDFMRAVSHDLNAPLRNIAGMATMAMVKWRDQLPEEVCARLSRIQANVDASGALISDLLELSRIKSRPQKRKMVQMARLVRESAETLEYELKRRGIELVISEPMPSLYVERNRIRQVFQNLIDNAIKYMHRSSDGRIEVGYRLADGQHEFTVSDNGPGIPEQEQQRIFHVFRRVRNSANAGIKGKGIGLSLVKTVVSNYDGRVWVESEPGLGATFTVTFGVRCTQPPANDRARQVEARCRTVISG